MLLMRAAMPCRFYAPSCHGHASAIFFFTAAPPARDMPRAGAYALYAPRASTRERGVERFAAPCLRRHAIFAVFAASRRRAIARFAAGAPLLPLSPPHSASNDAFALSDYRRRFIVEIIILRRYLVSKISSDAFFRRL
jgi:hypothetical protein